MTEKRFSWEVIDHDCLFYDDGAVIDYDDVVDILNEQHENLKGCNKTANNAIETIKALNEENEKLKKQSIHFENEMHAYKGSEEYYKQLLIEKDEEILHLKNALNKIKEIINEE